VVAPGDDGVEVADEMRREPGGEGFAVELGGEAGGEILEHDEADEDGVARRPGSRLVAEETEFEWEMGALELDGGVDSCGVALDLVELVGREGCEGSVGGVAQFESALEAVVGEEGWAEDLGESSCGVAAEGIHLPETVLRGDEALGEEEIVERGCADVWDAVCVALDSDRGGEGGKGDGAVELREGVVEGLVEPVARDEVAGGGDENGERDEGDGDAAEDTAAFRQSRGFFQT